MNETAYKSRINLFVFSGLILGQIIVGGITIFAQNGAPESEKDLPEKAKTEEIVSPAKPDAVRPESLQAVKETDKTDPVVLSDAGKIAERTIGGISVPKHVRLNSNPSTSDVVVLKNGDRLTGKIARSDGKTLLIKTEFAGDVNVVWEAIDELSTTEKVYLTLTDGQVVAGTVKTQNGQIIVDTEKAGVVATSKSAVTIVRSEAEQTSALAEAERLRNPKLWELWQGNFDVGLSLTSGNSRTFNFAMGANAVRETTRDKLSFYFAQIYARDDTDDLSRTTANAIRSGIRYDFNINKKLSGFGFADFETNELQGLDLRLVFGGGLNYRWIETERKKLDVFGGISVNNEFFAEPDPLPVDFDNTRTSFELLFGDEYFWKISDSITLKQRAVIFPNMSDFGEFRLNFDTTLGIDLNKRLAWQFTFSDRFLSNPPDGFKQNDILFATGLRVKFGR